MQTSQSERQILLGSHNLPEQQQQKDSTEFIFAELLLNSTWHLPATPIMCCPMGSTPSKAGAALWEVATTARRGLCSVGPLRGAHPGEDL